MDKVRESAARLNDKNHPYDGIGYLEDARTVSEWALPLLDDRPIDEAFLGAFHKNDRGNWVLRRSTPHTWEIEFFGGGFWLLSVDDRVSPVPLKQLKTRGQLRTLCLALGITLKERTQTCDQK